MAQIQIPLVGGSVNAHQTFTMALGGRTLDFTLNYIETLEQPQWSMDISENGQALISGATLEPSRDVIRVYNAGIGKLYFIGEEVTLDNLGVDNQLIWAP